MTENLVSRYINNCDYITPISSLSKVKRAGAPTSLAYNRSYLCNGTPGLKRGVKATARILILGLWLILARTPMWAHESPIDHVDRNIIIHMEGGKMHVQYTMALAERAVLLQMLRMDTSKDGKVSDGEREAFFKEYGAWLVGMMGMTLDGKALELKLAKPVVLSPPLNQTWYFVASPGDMKPGRYEGAFDDGLSILYPGRFRARSSKTATDTGRRAVVSRLLEVPKTGPHAGRATIRFLVLIPDD